MSKKLFSASAISVLVLACSACGTVPVDFNDPNADGSAATDGASTADAGSPADAGKAAEECPDGWNKAQSDGVALCWKKFEVGLTCPKGYVNVGEGLDFDKNLVCTKKVEDSTDDAGSVDAGKAADVASTADAGSPVDKTLEDKDNDGHLAKVDCNDNDPAVHLGATEVCNGKDDDCDGVIDEGCPAPQQPVDKDGDGYTDSPKDCNDNDPAVHPGATEVCNGKDDDCDGVVDEGCTPASVGNNVLTITYPKQFSRILNVQVVTSKSLLGKQWDSGSTYSSGTTLTKNLGNVPSGCAYVRWNVVDSDPDAPWNTACAGNGASATMFPSAIPSLVLNGKTYSAADNVTWSDPAGTSGGCSGLFIQGGSSCNL